MFPYTFEAVTAITVAVISMILSLYFLVLKRKGWLRNSQEDFYRCPNSECRKMFQKPITLTDLSTKPPRGYLACPHCGLDLEKASVANLQKTKAGDRIPPFNELKLLTDHLEGGTKRPKSDTTVEVKPSKTLEVSKSTIREDIFKGSRKPTVVRDSKSLVQPIEIGGETPSKPYEKPEEPVGKKPFQVSSDCPHFFGYVRRLPKNTPIPDECLGCSRIVECLTHHADQVEA